MFNMLRYCPYFSGDSHIVMVTIPAWNNMEMEMVVDSSPCNPAKIEAYVKAVRLQVGLEYSAAVLEHGHERKVLITL